MEENILYLNDKNRTRLDDDEIPIRANINTGRLLYNRNNQNLRQGNYSGLTNKSFDVYNSQPIKASNRIMKEHDTETAFYRSNGNNLPSNELINSILTKKLISIINQRNNEVTRSQEKNLIETDIYRLLGHTQQRKTIEEQILEKRAKEQHEEQFKARESQILLDRIIQAFNKGYEMREKKVKFVLSLSLNK